MSGHRASKRRCDGALVHRIERREQQTHRDRRWRLMRLADCGDPVEYRFQCDRIEWRHHVAMRVDALGQFEPQILRANMRRDRRLRK